MLPLILINRFKSNTIFIFQKHANTHMNIYINAYAHTDNAIRVFR